MILGSSICFVIVTSAIDIVNFIGGCLGKITYRSLIDKPSQVKNEFVSLYLILYQKIIALTVISLACGGVYGLVFGAMSAQTADHLNHQMNLMREERYCLVIGVLLGAFGGVINELLRKNVSFDCLFFRVKEF